ncbi:MAG: hypothetical protein K2X08_03760 [Chlamydiales bacterium]|nr:hypothetical protein [Chlamydiales bacterium]
MKIEEALDQITTNHLAKDCFHFQIIELPQSSYHRIFRCQNLVAVLSMNKTGQKVQSLALWSLITKCKLWDLEIIQDYTESNPGSCILSEYGMVLIDVPSTKCKIIALDGKQSGVLPKLQWHSIVPLGMRILGCWAERHNPNDQEPCWLPENTNHFFGEYDQEGKSLNRYQLDHTRGRWTYTYACNENFWVRLSGSDKPDLASIIEVVDRVIGKMKTFELPFKSDEEKFSSACIVQNRLLYGKNAIRPWSKYHIKVKYEPTIYIFDLVKGTIIEEFPTGAEKGEPKNLVATQYYAAWLEYRGGSDDRVKYLDILNKTIKDGTTVSYCVDSPQVILNIVGTILSVTYAEGDWNTGWARWRRKIIDMTNGELKCDARYKRFPWGECSIANGNMLITDYFSNPSRIYIESFINEGISSKESNFRDKPQ